MLAPQSLFHRPGQGDEATVQVSDANSHLGQLLLEADWEELTNYLSTDEGRRDVDANNDPLGLAAQAKKGGKRAKIPSGKDTAFFAALFVRAPFDAIAKIYSMAPSQVDHPDDLMYTLSVIPSEEEVRLGSEAAKKVPYRTRTWTADEYYRLLDLLLQSFIKEHENGSKLLHVMPKWMVGETDLLMTPLAVAAYNPDVPANILQNLCALQPMAMEKECRFFGHKTVPIVVAAASPLPPPSSANFDAAKRLRWEKVTLLTLHKGWYHGYYDQQREMLNEAVAAGKQDIEHPLEAPQRPEPTIGQIKDACEEAIKLKEWELVREFLRKNAAEELEEAREALAAHDETAGAEEEKRQHAREQMKARDEWMHNNMGLVMYPVNAFLDVVSAVVPDLTKHDEEGAIVGPMS